MTGDVNVRIRIQPLAGYRVKRSGQNASLVCRRCNRSVASASAFLLDRLTLIALQHESETHAGPKRYDVIAGGEMLARDVTGLAANEIVAANPDAEIVTHPETGGVR